MNEKRYPRRSDSRKRNDEPELILDSDDETSYNNVATAQDTNVERPSAALADEPMSIQTSQRSSVFGNEYYEIRERFFRIVDSRPDMKPHDLKCILWDMLPPYDDEYSSQTASRLVSKIDDLYKRMGNIETCMSSNGDFGRAVRVTQRKVDKIQGTTEYLLDIAKGETEAFAFTRQFNPVIDMMESTTNNCVKKLNAASKEVKSSVNDVDKAGSRVNIPLMLVIWFCVCFVALLVFQCVATAGYLFFNMSLSDLGWMIWLAPSIVVPIFIFTAADKYFNRQKPRR